MALFDDNYVLTDEQFCEGLQKQEMLHNPKKSGIVFKCDDEYMYTDVSDKHTLLFGSTGSKKTRNFCIPSVFAIGSAGESMIISDPKGEIYLRTSGYLSSLDYSVRVINFRNPCSSECWNPLIVPYRCYKSGNADKALEMVADLTSQIKGRIHSEKDNYWEESATSLLFSIIIMLFEIARSEKEVNFASITKIRGYISSSDDKEKDIFWDLVEQFKDNIFVKGRINSILSIKNTEKTLGCVLSTFDTMLQDVLINRERLSMLSHMTFEYDEIFTKKTVIYLILPDEKTTFHFLASIFIKQLYEYLIDRSYFLGGEMPIRVNYILDEFSNLPYIKDMPAMISAARSRNIRFFIIVQSAAQLECRYKEEAKTIKSNCANWIFLPSREMELLREISELCGQVYVDDRGYRPLFSISSLQCLKVGYEDSQALVLRNNMRPYVTWIKDFSLYPQAKFQPLDLKSNSFGDMEIVSVAQFMIKKLENDSAITPEISRFQFE